MTIRRIPFVVIAVTLAACEGGDVTSTAPRGPEVDPPLLGISDGQFEGNRFFYFLPPMVDQPGFGGTFNATLEPLVRICAGRTDCTSGTAILEAVATSESDHYHFDWMTRGSEQGVYRVHVLVAGIELGFADVALKNRVRGNGRPDNKDDDVEVKAGRTLPIKFRIEVGAICEAIGNPECNEDVFGAGGGTLNVDQELGLQVAGGALNEDVTIVLERLACPQTDGRVDFFPIDIPQFGGCFQARAIPDLGEPIDPGFVVGICLDEPTGLSHDQQDRLQIHRSEDPSDPGATVEALPNADAPFIDCDGTADAGLHPILRWARRGWRELNRTLNPLAAQPAYATHKGFGGKAGEFSFFVWALPSQMAVNAGDGQEAPVEHAVPIPPSVIVTDEGGDPVADARVRFEVTGGGGDLDGPMSVELLTGSDGIAEVADWFLGSTAGTNTLRASGRGIADPLDGGPFADEDDPVPLETGEVGFTAVAIAYSFEQDGSTYPVSPLEGITDIESFYSYDSRVGDSSDTGLEESDVSLLFFYRDPDGVISLVMIHDEPVDGSGGKVVFEFGGLPTGADFAVRDDDGTGEAVLPTSEWRWAVCCTDGGAIDGLNGTFQFTIDPTFFSGGGLDPGAITDWVFLSGDLADPDEFALDLLESITLRAIDSP